MTVRISKPSISLREKLSELERPPIENLLVKRDSGEVAETITGEFELKKFDQVKHNPIVDIFVYDTREDSDGGEWRKHTKTKSWYLEELNTATRGSRREFPQVAILTVEHTVNRITIYDADQPDCPMWMVFTAAGSGRHYMYGTGDARAIAMKNGAFITGAQATNYWPIYVDFIRDDCLGLRIGGGSVDGHHRHGLPISGRNTTNTDGNQVWRAISGKLPAWYIKDFINNQLVHDVAMTVLPNAPISPDTGLPIPTIALATEGGCTIIRDDGLVSNMTFSSQNGSKVWKVSFDKDNKVCMLLGYSNVYTYVAYVHEIPAGDIALSSTDDRILSTTDFSEGAFRAFNNSDTPYGRAGNINNFVDAEYYATDHGLSILYKDERIKNNQLIAHINTQVNSGWIPHGAKGAYINTSDKFNYVSPELVSSGNTWVGAFDNATDLNSFTSINNASLSISNSELTVGYNGSTSPGAQFELNVEGGKTYLWTFLGRSSDSTQLIKPRLEAQGDVIFDREITDTSINLSLHTNTDNMIEVRSTSNHNTEKFYYVLFRAKSDGLVLMKLFANYNASAVYDAVSVRLALRDLSSFEYNHGRIIGTLNNSPVAEGADLQCLSGFDSNNYVEAYREQSYGNPGVITMMGWSRLTDISDYGYMASVTGNGSVVVGLSINRDTASVPGQNYFYDNVNSSVHSDIRTDDGQWHFIVGVLNGKTKEIWVDGRLAGKSLVSPVNLTAINRTNIGHYAPGTGNSFAYHHRGDLALVRVANIALTAEQIKKIYYDEKDLFVENAKCFIPLNNGVEYPNQINDVAYDRTNKLLHVGTGNGRSVFQGLKRIEHYPGAITTTLSVANGIVAGL